MKRILSDVALVCACAFAFVFGATPATPQVAVPETAYLDSADVVSWREDLRFMAREMERRHRNLYHTSRVPASTAPSLACTDGFPLYSGSERQAGRRLSRELRQMESPTAADSVSTMTASDNAVGTCTQALSVIFSPTKTRIKATPGFR
jgi:hypothetical protein